MANKLEIVIGAKDAASRPIGAIASSLDSLGRTASTVGTVLATGLAAGVGGLTVALGASVRTAADFEQALANTRAATGATAEQMARMREEALGIGKDTSKSASEAAEAMGELVKAGMPVETVISGAARAVVQLAEATGSDVTEMAILTSNALNTFKASGIDAAGVAELVARAANASSIGTSEMATALQAVGPVAAQAGLNMEDFATAVGLMGNNSLKGSDAGTSLKTMLLALTAPSSAAAKELAALGVAVFDGEGKTKGFRDILGQLQTSLAGATEQQKAAALSTIFGTDAIRAANILLGEGVQGWDAFRGAMSSAPSLSEQAAIRMATLNGIIEQIKGTIETLAINIGTQALPAITELGKIALKALGGDFAGAWSAAHKAVTDAIPRVRDAADTLLQNIRAWISDVAVPAITARLGEWSAAFVNWVGPAWEGLRKNLDAIGQQVWSWVTTTGAPLLRDKLGEWSAAFYAWVDAVWPDLERNLVTLLDDIGGWIDRNAPTIGAYLERWSAEFADWALNVWGANNKKLDRITDGISTWVASRAAGKVKEIFGGLFANLPAQIEGELSASGEQSAERWTSSFFDGLVAQFKDPQTANRTLTAWNENIQRFALGPMFGPGSVLFKTILKFFEDLGTEALKALFKRFTGMDLPGGGGGSGSAPGSGGGGAAPGGGTTPTAPPAAAPSALRSAATALVNSLAAGMDGTGLYFAMGDLGNQAMQAGKADAATLFRNLRRDLPQGPVTGDTVDWIRRSINAVIPNLAEGGVVRSRPGGTLVRVGEGGYDEAVVPLRRGGGGAAVYELHFHGPVYGVRDFEDVVVRALVSAERGGRVALGVTR